VLPGLINLDFADVRTVMTEMGKAMMGTGEAQGEGRALMAAENAIQNPLLDEVSLKGAKAVLVNITGGLDMTLLEVDEAANAISAQVDPDANIIFGAAFDPTLKDTLRVSVVATGMDGASIAAIEPAPRRSSFQRPVVETIPEPEPLAEPEPALELEPVLEIEAEPVAGAIEPEPELAIAPVTPAPPPKIFEPLRAAAYAHSPSAVVVAEPADAAPELAPEVVVTRSEPEIRTVARIVDPSVADDEDELEPLFPQGSHYADDRRQKGGWLSLFGRTRHDAPQASLRSAGSAQPSPQAAPEAPADDNEDLEIPSFLRRLAN